VKILDKYLLKTFLTTFFTVFTILMFVFILQMVWLFIGELAGKDIDLVIISKFLLFGMPKIVPLVLPLSVLLASIMSFGSLSENYEFAAMKSAGISLQRAMKSIIIFIGILSVIAFLFANSVIPYAEFKFTNFRKNIAQSKPALAITEGQFSDVGFYNIKVNKKSGENGNTLTGITIHEKSTDGQGTKTVIRAKNGLLISSEKSNTLQLVLYDGYYYNEVSSQQYQDRSKMLFAKSDFKKYIINLDLTQLNGSVTDNSVIKNTNNMLNVSELNYTLDSLHKTLKTDIISFSENNNQRINILQKTVKDTLIKKLQNPKDLLLIFNNNERLELLKTALLTNSSTQQSLEATKNDLINKQKIINEHLLALYDKFVIAFACFLMFFIGAPLGAIIKKGGLGLPIVFAVLIFISFHFINTFGKRIAQENGLTPFLGAWMSAIILSPLAIWLTYRATNDLGSGINFDVISIPFQKMFQKINALKRKSA
jgi:lipopolysaccharide export system permease protein